jgi:hypothetical protein
VQACAYVRARVAGRKRKRKNERGGERGRKRKGREGERASGSELKTTAKHMNCIRVRAYVCL